LIDTFGNSSFFQHSGSIAATIFGEILGVSKSLGALLRKNENTGSTGLFFDFRCSSKFDSSFITYQEKRIEYPGMSGEC